MHHQALPALPGAACPPDTETRRQVKACAQPSGATNGRKGVCEYFVGVTNPPPKNRVSSDTLKETLPQRDESFAPRSEQPGDGAANTTRGPVLQIWILFQNRY